MSKNISNLSGRIGLKDNLFKQISENTLSDTPKDIKEIAKEHNLGVSTLHEEWKHPGYVLWRFLLYLLGYHLGYFQIFV